MLELLFSCLSISPHSLDPAWSHRLVTSFGGGTGRLGADPRATMPAKHRPFSGPCFGPALLFSITTGSSKTAPVFLSWATECDGTDVGCVEMVQLFAQMRADRKGTASHQFGRIVYQIVHGDGSWLCVRCSSTEEVQRLRCPSEGSEGPHTRRILLRRIDL